MLRSQSKRFLVSLVMARAANILHLAIRIQEDYVQQLEGGDIQNYIQHNKETVSIIREISKFVHQNMLRFVYFQETFRRIRESWQLCFSIFLTAGRNFKEKKTTIIILAYQLPCIATCIENP